MLNSSSSGIPQSKTDLSHKSSASLKLVNCETRQGSYSRVRAHLLGIKGIGIAICKSAIAGHKQKMKQLEEAYEEKKAKSNAKEVALPCEAGVGFKKRKVAATNKIDGYVPPGYNKLRTTLLQKENDNVHRQLEPLGSTWKEKVNCFGEVKNRFFIADVMKEVINEIGHQNVVQIITDNAANCKAVGQLIESQFPHIYWTPCVVHTLNLAVKNICSPNNVETNALAIITILLSVADTCFASIIVMLKRLKLIKTGLQAMVISEEWSSYRDDDTVKANFVKEKIVNDEWWIKYHIFLVSLDLYMR
ncbi:putative hAT dimerization domain, ribonuclease H-like domain protein [Tanacetum coccineum]